MTDRHEPDTPAARDDQLAAQLRALGQAAEHGTTATPSGAVVDLPRSIDVDHVPPPDATQLGAGVSAHGSSVRRRVLAPALVAAALLMIAVGSYAVFNRPNPAAESSVAAQEGTGEPDLVLDDNGWEALRQCESTGNYSVDSGNSFYGAYQFTRPAWNQTIADLNLDGVAPANPAEARPALQDAAANALYTSAGADAWPICGRYLRGPMVTPVVPQWLSGSARAHDETIVFINPEKSGDLSEFEIAIRDIIGSDFEDRVRTFDQQEGLRMFLEMFSSDDRVRDSVVADDIPAAFHIAGDLGSADEQRLRDIPGVLQVIPAGLVASQPEPMRLSISAIGLDTPVRGDAAAPTLLQGPGLLASGPRGLVAVGYGAAADEAIAHDATPHAFARLAELEVGDRARLFELVGDATAGSVEVVRHFEVDQVTATTVDELEPLPTDGPVGLVLVATGDTPGDRVVVRLLQVSPDLTAYGIDQ